MYKKTRIILLQICILFGLSHLYSQEVIPSEIDLLVEKVRTTSKVPGIAVSIIKDGKIILSKGFGVSSISSAGPVSEKTLFGIASNTKAFTAVALGILVDENKIKWDDKVIKYIPELKMYDDCVTNQLTIRDLITHRSGLGFEAGNLMLVPYENKFNIKDIIFNLRFLKPAYDFRTKFEYNDLMYVIAGEVISRVSAVSWKDFIFQKILNPLEMHNTFPSPKEALVTKDVSIPHVLSNGKIVETTRDFSEAGNAAGGIYSNLFDLNKWVDMLINGGEFKGGRLISKEVFQELFSPQNIIGEDLSYGLGWFIKNEKGLKIVTHEGEILGNYSKITLLPEKKIGIIVLTNQQSEAAIYGITIAIKNMYTGDHNYQQVIEENVQEELSSNDNAYKIQENVSSALKTNNQAKSKNYNLQDFTGIYKDNWFGNVEIFIKNNNLFFQSEKSPLLLGEMKFYSDNKFVIRWINKNLYADAFISFNLDKSKKVIGMKMEAISPQTDASYDFQDLDFSKQVKR